MSVPHKKKFNAQRAALRALGENAIEGFDFVIEKVGVGYVWRKPEAQAEAEPAPLPEATAEPESAEPESAEPISPVRFVAFAQLSASPLNPRRSFDEDGIAELAESIAESGILQNLVVRPDPEPHIHIDCFELVSGERRLRAIARLVEQGRWDSQAETIPVKVIQGDDAEVLALALLENLQREAVNPMEEAEGMAALHRLDPARWSTAEIARRIGKTPRHVQLRLALTDRLTDDTRAALRDGRINLAQARALTGMPAKIQGKTVKAIADGKSWTLRAADLKHTMFADLVPVERAIFDPAAQGVETVEDEDGAVWLDREAFKAAQDAAVQAKVDELAAEWAWAEKRSYFFAGDFEPERTENRAVGGALVIVDWQNNVRIEAGLVRLPPRAADPAAAARQGAHAARNAAQQDLQAQIWDRLHDDEAAALALCAYGLLCHDHSHHGAPTDIRADHDWTTPRLRQAFPELAQFETDPRRDIGDHHEDGAGIAFTPADDRVGLFAELRSWPKAKLARLIAGIAADSVVVNSHQMVPHPVTAALLAGFGIPLPDFWTDLPADGAEAEAAE